MGSVVFQHEQIGNLAIDNGIDDARWGYNLNTATFPTYGGEVIQILSVYIDDLTLAGTCATYRQMEAIYEFFAEYFQIATQGKNPTPNVADSVSGTAYNLRPVYFTYLDRNWYFKIYPKTAPGFTYGREVVTPTWQLSAHVIDDSPDLGLIKDGIKSLATQKLADGTTLVLDGQISPRQGNPDTDPFQTFTQGIAKQQQVIQKYSDYYNSLIPAYQQGDFSALTAGIGAFPNFGQNNNQPTGTQTVLPKPRKPKEHGGGTGVNPPPIIVPPSGVPHNADYQAAFNVVWSQLHDAYVNGGCSSVVTAAANIETGFLQLSLIDRTAAQDAIASFHNAPYHCNL